MISIVIPTYNEKENIENIIPKIEKFLRSEDEIIVVDDNSSDGTSKSVKKLNEIYKNIKLIERPKKMGAASAVIDGMKSAKNEIVGAMDPDGSHPPEVIEEMREYLPEYDMIVASRYVKGGGIENWPLKRKVISFGATLLSKPLTKIKDPMSGFFLIKKDLIKFEELNSISCKIMLDIIIRSEIKKIKEVPYVFADRIYGKTKMTKMHFPQYINHIISLFYFKIRKYFSI